MAVAQPEMQIAKPPVASGASSVHKPLAWANLIVYALLIGFSIFALVPFVFSFLSSFKTFEHVLDFPPSLLPQPWTGSNYVEIFTKDPNFSRWLLNSLFYAVGAMVLNVLFSAMAGYAFARLRFPGREVLFVTTLAVMMIPLQTYLIPRFLIFNSLHTINTFFALFLPVMAQPFSVFLMTQFLKGLPYEMEESAMIDGASRFRTFFQIILPLSKPALVATAILSFQAAWNDFLWPLIVTQTPNMYTFPVGLSLFKNAHFTEYNLLLAGAVFNTLPMIIIFFIFQRYFIQGVGTTGLGGR